MNSIGQEAAVYTDFSQLESLKAEAQANPNAALEEVAQQFESLFMQMMLKSMRDATIKSDLFSSDQMDTYQTMADQQTALSLSQQGGIGLARILVEQMQVRGQVSGDEFSTESSTSTADDSGIPLT
ncbi:MAG: rod-binding protein, partial [Flavobacteriaceae bacterium]|nr:rod-binding protein [Flavobacteriaceae bacterium]